MTKWKPPGGGGRPPGARNRFQKNFWETLEADFKEHGAKTVEVMRIENPAAYVKMCAYLMPRDMFLEVANKPLTELSDEFLDALEKAWKAGAIEPPPMKVIVDDSKKEESIDEK